MKQALIVLGMHRSGTSSVAGTLALLGAASPKTLMPAHPDNQKGYWESAPLVELNDRILASAGSNWSDWRAFGRDWEASAAAAVLKQELGDLIVQEFGDSPLIVLKDPRLCRLFPIWKDALHAQGYTLHILMPLRSPLEIAASLAKRDGYSTARSLLIWLRNMLEAEHTSRGLPRCVFHWTDFMRDWRGETDRFSNALGLTFPRQSDLTGSDVDQFLDLNLRRNVNLDRLPSQVHAWFSSVDQAFQRLVSDPRDADALECLDDVRQQFDASADIYGVALAALENELTTQSQSSAQRYNELAAHCAALQQGHDHLQAHIANMTSASEARIAELIQSLEQANHSLQDLAQTRDAEVASASQITTGLHDTIAALQAQHAASLARIAEIDSALASVNSAFQVHHAEAATRHDEDSRRILELEETLAALTTSHHQSIADLEGLHTERLARVEDDLARSERKYQTLIKAMKGSPLKSALRVAAGREPL